MSERSYSASELVGLPGMPPKSERSVYLFEKARKMVRVPGAKPARWYEYSLPQETQAALAAARADAGGASGDPGTEGSAGVGASRSSSFPDRDAPSLLTGRDADRADARLWYLKTFEQFHQASGGPVMEALRAFSAACREGKIDVPDYVAAAVKPPAWNTLQGWRRTLAKDGLRGLAGSSWGRPKGGTIDADVEVRDFITAQILERPGHVNCKMIIRALRVTFDQSRVPSYRTLQRWVATWRRNNARLISAVADPDRHRSSYMPAGGDAGAGIVRLNQLWELDSTPADIICTDGRHAIVGAIDVYSRRMMVLVAPTSRASAIAALLRRAILSWGVPEVVRTDEGADYTSRHIRRALADLGCHHDILPPYSPQRKPFIERGLGSLSRMLELLPGFAGHNVAEAQALRARKSFAQRRGEGDAEAFEVALTAADLQAACDAWLQTVYEREPHSGLNGRQPFEMAAGQPRREIADERVLDLLLAEPADGDGWRTVQKKGVFVEGTSFIAAELGALVGDRVQVRMDPTDAGTIYVFDAAGAFVARAVAPEREGIDRADVAAQMKAQARLADSEARKFARELKKRVKPASAVEAILNAGQMNAASVVAFPAQTQAHDSPGVTAARQAAATGEAAKQPKPVITDEMRERSRQRREQVAEEEKAASQARQDRIAAIREKARQSTEDDEPVAPTAGRPLDEWYKRGGSSGA